jgi:hypothetical protein
MRKKIDGNIKEEFWSFFLVGFPNKKAFFIDAYFYLQERQQKGYFSNISFSSQH